VRTAHTAGPDSSARRHNIAPRRVPHQKRAQKRVQEILDVTTRLMEQSGVDNLTTNHVAAELGISVGTLYHYFPNKHAILHAMGVRWLNEWQRAFDEIEQMGLSGPRLGMFIDQAVERMLRVYSNQPGVQHLVRTMFIIPELQEIDSRGDELAVQRLTTIFRSLGIHGRTSELARKARVVLKLINSLLLEAVTQKGAAQRHTLDDLKALIACELGR